VCKRTVKFHRHANPLSRQYSTSATSEWAETQYKSTVPKPTGFVFFWIPEQLNGHFSQWYLRPFTVDGVEYNCAEQYMMASKARIHGDEETRKKIMEAASPSEHKSLGRLVKNFESAKWEQQCEEIVFKGNAAKFSQHEDLKAALLATKHYHLVSYLRISVILIG